MGKIGIEIREEKIKIRTEKIKDSVGIFGDSRGKIRIEIRMGKN